jgi:hypothetical protein
MQVDSKSYNSNDWQIMEDKKMVSSLTLQNDDLVGDTSFTQLQYPWR